MSVEQHTAEPESTCDHCGAADETVRECHLAPIGNLVSVDACADCRRRFGTVESREAVGEVHGLTAPDGVCLVCRDAGAAYSVELEVPVAGQVGYVAGSLCGEHADTQVATLLAPGAEPSVNGGDR
jgi:hypothetical protein